MTVKNQTIKDHWIRVVGESKYELIKEFIDVDGYSLPSFYTKEKQILDFMVGSYFFYLSLCMVPEGFGLILL